MPVYDEVAVRRFFGVTDDDINANGYGRLGRGQRRSYRTIVIIWSVILVVWLAAMSFAVVIQLDGDSWHGAGNFVCTLGFIALIAAMPAFFIRQALPFLSAGLRVIRVTGQVSVGNGFLTVAGQRLRTPARRSGQAGLRPWLDESLTYDVFAARGRAIGLTRAA